MSGGGSIQRRRSPFSVDCRSVASCEKSGIMRRERLTMFEAANATG